MLLLLRDHLRSFIDIEFGCLDFLNGENITPDLVSEPVASAISHTEVGSVSSSLGRCLELHRPSVFLFSFDSFVNLLVTSNSQIVTVGLDKSGLHRPGLLTIVAESPFFGKSVATSNYVLITKVLSDEASRMLEDLGRAKVLAVHLNGRSVLLLLMSILADNLHWGLLRISDLEERVFMTLGLLAFLTEIEVVTDRTHVADASDGTNIAMIADEFLVNNLCLGSLLLSHTVNQHASELVSTVALDFTFHGIEGSLKKLALESTGTIALFAWFGSFLVLLRALALVAIHSRRFILLVIKQVSSLRRFVHVVENHFSGEVSDFVLFHIRFFNFSDFRLLDLFLLNRNDFLLLLLFRLSLLEGVVSGRHASSLRHHVNLLIELLGIQAIERH